MTQKCVKCKEVKLFEEFTRDRTKPSGRFIYCKKCHGPMQKKSRERNKHRNLGRRKKVELKVPFINRLAKVRAEAKQHRAEGKRRCYLCKKVKLVEEYYGKSYECKKCHNEKVKLWYRTRKARERDGYFIG